MVPGAILAAGSSRRMGRSKALLPAGASGPTFVRRLAGALRAGGITDILVVGRPDDSALRAEVELLRGDLDHVALPADLDRVAIGADVRYVENHRAEDGQISSIIAAVNVVDHPGVQGLLVVPVDQPLVSAGAIATLLEAFSRARPPIARATHRGRHGHPVVFAPAVFGALRQADRSLGARAVVHAHAGAILDVEVPDEGVLIDVDDPDDYANVFGTRL